MTSFYQGSLQEGIAAAVSDAKAVICFVRDDEELSSTWESAYFGDDEIAQAVNAKAVVLRLTAGSQEAGFLASFCPVSKFPTVVLIKNGTLKEYIGPDISKDDFRNRLIAALDNDTSPSTMSSSVSNDTPGASTSSPAPVPVSQPQPQVETKASKPTGAAQNMSQAAAKNPKQSTKPSPKETKPAGPSTSVSPNQVSKEPKLDKGKAPMGTKKPTPKVTKKGTAPIVEQKVKPAKPRGPPSEYRLQVRLFDGRSVRSSFTPTQSIKNDVRPWLDQQMEEDTRPYNLKQILNPLPSETLTVAQESQTLRDLGIGSTANLVMVPVSTYTEAYSAAGSLPARGISAVYGLASSAASTATGLVSSFLGYGAAATPEPTPASEPSGSTQRPRTSGPNIRTLRDQQDGRGNSQLYNGNQLNFEPRKNQDKDK
ncbi:UBX protein [Penicillium brevicompactum]